MNLSKNVKSIVVLPAQSASQGTKKGAILDMQGVEGVQFVAVLTSAVDTSVVKLQVAQSDTNTTGSMVVLTGSVDAPAAVAANLSGKALILDLYKPLKRYIEPQVVIATENATVSCIIAIMYESRSKPQDLDDSVLSDLLLISPEEA
ncbi:MAG: hypothetical protein COB02_11815 [Candidatus Cloacimonadota bacterium]|nr:MAG: hypothetical protein COB02_11815 [Candidatus Cloacimonadota bacterium]